MNLSSLPVMGKAGASRARAQHMYTHSTKHTHTHIVLLSWCNHKLTHTQAEHEAQYAAAKAQLCSQAAGAWGALVEDSQFQLEGFKKRTNAWVLSKIAEARLRPRCSPNNKHQRTCAESMGTVRELWNARAAHGCREAQESDPAS